MRTQMLQLAALVGAAGMALSACSHRGMGGATISDDGVITTVSPRGKVTMSQTAPPPPRHEAIPGDATAEQVWVPGFWMNHNGNWVWMRGHYETRPASNAQWIPGEWNRVANGWEWVPGRWE